MRKLKLFSMLLLLLIGVGQMWATSPDNYSFSSFSSSSTVNLTTTDGFTITLAKNNGGTDPAWASSQARVYAKGSLTITIPAASNYKITSVIYTYVVNKNKKNVAPTIDGVSGADDTGTWNSSSKTWTASGTGATSVTFSTSGTAGNVGFTAVSITYTSGGGGGSNNPTVSFAPEAGTYCSTQNVTLSSDVDGATIYYTTNGSNPTTSSSVYSSAISVSSTTTIKAFAKKDSNTGDVAEATYTITSKEDPTITPTDGNVEVGSNLDVSTLFTSNSEGAITYSITAGSSYATIDGSTLSGVAAGSVTVQASQAANGCYNAKTATATITVNEHVITPGTYDSPALGYAFWGLNAEKTSATANEVDYTGSFHDVTVNIKNNTKTNAWFKEDFTRAYADYTMVISVPSGFNITQIVFSAESGKWAGDPTASPASTGSTAKTWTGKSNSVTFTFSGTDGMTGISVTYAAEVKSAVTFSAPTGGTLVIKDGDDAITSDDEFAEDKVLDVLITPTAATHHGGIVKVIKTGVSPEVDVTSTDYNSGTGKLTIKNYDITVSATFVADAAISVAVAAGQSSWGSVKLYNSTSTEVSSGTTFKPAAGFKIEATPASDDYEFVSWAKSDGSDITLSVADAAKSNPTLTAGEVSTTFTATFREKDKPYLAVDPASLTFGPIAVNDSQEKTFELTGEFLTANASLEITSETEGDVGMFSVDASVDRDGDGLIAEDVTVTYNPTAAGTHTATLTISSTGATPVEVALSGEAKVLRTVKWYSSNSTEITGDDLGEATTSVLDGGKVTTLPDDPESCDESISFQGWTNATYTKSNTAPTVLFTDAKDAPTISGGNVTYYAVWANGGAKSDELTLSTTGVDAGTTYADWSGKTVNSTAVYAGNSAGDKSSIQLRSNNSTSGVITTTSGGKATKVSVEWQSDTQAGRTLNVYGKNSAYSVASDLYGEATQGTLIGTIVKGTSEELTIEDDYEYIGVCSASGAMYLTSLTVQWSKVSDYATTCSAPVVIADPTFSVNAGTYNNSQSVELGFASPATAVYYTTDGTSDPRTDGTAYTSAIPVTADMTIKAAATDGNGNWSAVVTKEYVINCSFSIADFIAANQTASARYLRLDAAQNAIVTGVSTTQIFIQDKSNKGIILFNKDGFGSNEIAAGDKIVGAISGTYALYNGQPEIGTAVFEAGTTFTATDLPNPTTVTAIDATAYAANPMMLVKIEDLYYKQVSSNNYSFTTEPDGEGTTYNVYDNSLRYFTGKTLPASSVACDIVGILARNNDAYRLLPVSLTTAATAALPTISPTGGADAENAVEVTYLSEISVGTVENEDITIKLNNVEKTDANPILVQGDLKLEVSAKRDFYADNSVTYYYKPSAYPKSITAVSAHGTMTVKVGDNVVETALPASTVDVTISNVADHFTLTGVAVKDADNVDVEVTVNAGVYSFEMPNKNVTITANYLEDTKYSITFNSGDAAGEGPTGYTDEYYAGTEITLPTKEQVNYTAPTDKVFNGWVVTYGDNVVVDQTAGKFNMPAGAVTITAQWADRVYCALTLNINGATTTTNIDREEEYTLPTNVDGISGYTFYGWAEDPEADDVEEAIDILESFTPEAEEASKTLYAVFKRTDNSNPNIGKYIKVTENQTDWSGQYLIVYESGNVALDGSLSTIDAVGNSIALTIANSIVTATTTANKTLDGSSFTFAKSGNAYTIRSAGGKYIGRTATSNGLNADATTAYTNVISMENSVIKITANVTNGYKLMYMNGTGARFRYYNNNQQDIQLYKKAAAPTYYTTAPSAVYAVSYALGGGAWQEDEGCDGANVKAGQSFDICESVPVRDHYKFVKWQVADEDVSDNITINAETEITAVWEAKVENNITYNAGTGTGDDAVVENNEEGAEIVLPSAAEKSLSKEGYNFVGWLYGGDLYEAGTTFEMPASAVTFVAQWKKQNITKMTLVTDVAQLVDGSKVVIVSKDPVSNSQTRASAIAGQLIDSKYLQSVTSNLTFNEDNTISYNAETAIELTLDNEEGGWALRNGDNYLVHSSGNQVKWQSDIAVWNISFSGNNATIKFSDNYSIQYNASSGSERFSAYSNAQNAVQLYASVTSVTGDASISEIGYVEGDVIVVSSGATLTMDAPSAPASITVKENAVVNVSAATEAGTVIVEKGAKLAIEEGGSVTTDEPLVLYTTLGKGTGTGSGSGNNPGSSSEIINAERLNATGDVFIEIELTQDAKASAGWYAFSVPFPVDAMNGVYYGDTKLTNEVGYAIMSYHGDIRATGKYGWKKFREIMQPGVLYVITVGNTDYKTLRFKKVADRALVASSSVAVSPFPTQTGNDADGAWNGIGNPNLAISNLSTSVPVMQFYDHKTNKFVGRNHSVNLVVGSAFFIQYDEGETVSIPVGITSNNGYLAPQRERQAAEEMVYEVQLTNATTGELEDNVFLTAREDATDAYEIGRDVAKMSMGAAKCAQMYVPAYGTNLCAADFQLVNDKAEYPLTITVPADGTYRIEAAEATEDATLYLTKDGRVMWNLSMSACEVELTKGTTENYGLLLVRKTPGVATGMENVQSDNVQCTKVIIDNQVFILRGGQMYDVTGKKIEK